MSAIIREERIGGQRLILGDCLEVMQELGRFDACVTDPPYGIGFQRGSGGKSIHSKGGSHNTKPIVGDDRPFDPAPFIVGKTIMFGGDHFAQRLPDGGMFHVWDKDPRGKMEWDSFSDAELLWTSWTTRRRVFRYLWKGLCQEGAGEKRHHPTQKPVALMEWCLGFVPNAKTILDPFMGSGTTLVACQRFGRMGTGIEIDPEYFDIACRRVDEATRQADLFITPASSPTQEAMDV